MNRIHVEDHIRKSSWSKTYEDEDRAYDNLKRIAKDENCYAFSTFEHLFIPLRTKNTEDLLKDLFLPTFFLTLEKTDSIAENFFYLALYMVLDVLTLPIRLITIIPRALSNTSKEDNEFYLTLKRISEHDENGSILDRALQNDYVNIILEYDEGGYSFEEGFYHKFTNLRYFDGANDSWKTSQEIGARVRDDANRPLLGLLELMVGGLLANVGRALPEAEENDDPLR